MTTFLHSDGITYRVERVRTCMMRRETTTGEVVPDSQCLHEHRITAARYSELHMPATEIKLGVRRGDIYRVLGDQAAVNLPKRLV